MENLYPSFAGGRILKKECLWAVRDYAYGAEQMYYQEVSDGILKGFDITHQEDRILIGKGLIKYDGFIYLADQTESVVYEAKDRLQVLKIRCVREKEIPDYDSYKMEICLDEEPELYDGEFELCRFNLRTGSVLRNDYKAFYDIETQYDTINLARAFWSSIGGVTLHPVILRSFARELLGKEGLGPQDYAFAYLVLNSRETVSGEIILSYIDRQEQALDGKELFAALERRLRFFGQHDAEGLGTDDRNEPMILVD